MPVVWLVGLLLAWSSCGSAAGSATSDNSTVARGDTFDEAIEVTLLSATHALVSLELRQSTWLGRSPTTFPQAVRRLAQGTPLSHLKLTLTRGRWDYRTWGMPSVAINPPGAEVAVQWAHPSLHTLHWTRLQHRLSGLMCASLNLLEAPHSAPHYPMRGLDSESFWHVGALPREAVCTENLTPWLQLLPCRGKAGLAGLLADRQYILSGGYHSLSLEVRVTPPTTNELGPATVLLTQRFTAVLRLKQPLTTSQKQQHVPLTHVLPSISAVQPCVAVHTSQLVTHQPLPETQPNDQNLPERTDQGNEGPADVSGDHVAEGQKRPTARGSVTGCGVRQEQQLGLKLRQALEGAQLLQPAGEQPCLPPALLLHAALRGTGLHKGQLQLVITQVDSQRVAQASAWPQHPTHYTTRADKDGGSKSGSSAATADMHGGSSHDNTATAERGSGSSSNSGSGSSTSSGTNNDTAHTITEGGGVCVQLTLPWVMRVWMHTLQVELDGEAVSSSSMHLSMSVEPSRDRGRPACIFMCMHVPPMARQVVLRARFTRAFLTLQEHPPDAHRGWDIPPARLYYWENDTQSQSCCTAEADGSGSVPPCQGSLQQVLGPGLLLQLATADVAMPYNVICLTSTVLAVFLGATLNTLMQRTSKGKAA